MPSGRYRSDMDKPRIINGELRMVRWPKNEDGDDIPVLNILLSLGATSELIDKHVNPDQESGQRWEEMKKRRVEK